MPDFKTFYWQLGISFGILGVLVGGLFMSLPFLRDVFVNPSFYFNRTISGADILVITIAVFLVIITVLTSYITYLLLTAKSRTAIEVWNATKSLAVSREQFRRLYESGPVPYLTLNEKGEIGEPNNAALRFFGSKAEDLQGKNLFSLCAPEDREVAETLSDRYKVSSPIDREEVRMVGKNGEIKYVSLSILNIQNAASEGHSGLATIFDITEQKKLSQAKTEFVSLASHQLNTPLTTMKWFTDLLLSRDIGPLTDKQVEYMRRLHIVNADMIELVDTLLNVSRIELGSLAVDLKPFNIQNLTNSVIDELSLHIEKKGIHIERQYNGLFEEVSTDPKLLGVVIQNLLSNAIKYTLDGGTITVVFEQEGNEKKISVVDTGLGIPQNAQKMIFTKLFRAENVRSLSISQGTGLGLYLVKSIIESLGGSIRFVSEEGRGSTFTITF